MKTLGPRTAKGAADQTGNNSGNWTVVFDPATLNVNVAEFEVYHMVVLGAPGSTFNVYVDSHQWDTNVFGTQNSWDPSQPLIMRPGETLYFYYSDPITDNNPPVVTVHLRYNQNEFR